MALDEVDVTEVLVIIRSSVSETRDPFIKKIIHVVNEYLGIEEQQEILKDSNLLVAFILVALGWPFVLSVFCLFVFLFISHLGFKSWIWLLIAPVPVHCFSITFTTVHLT